LAGYAKALPLNSAHVALDWETTPMHSNTFSMDAIATIRSCYSQRFGIPRQPGLVKSAVAAIEFEPTADNELALRDLSSFSHLWVVFVFHAQHYTRFKPLVQPPRLGGKATMFSRWHSCARYQTLCIVRRCHTRSPM